MSIAKVLRLDEYRDRRSDRLRLARALYATDRNRHAVMGHLAEVAELAGADRVAAVWVDEYGSGLVHPHVVLDQLSDRPRREFSSEPLREAWELGIPSALDRPPQAHPPVPTTLAVSLGSDGARAWFLLAESVAARPPLDGFARDRIMFLAGECSAVLLHRDLDQLLATREYGVSGVGFAGWPILEDLEGGRRSDDAGLLIAKRFIVGRLVRMLLDDDLVVAPDRVSDQVARARSEMETGGGASSEEVALWERALDAIEEHRFPGLARALVEIGESAEGAGHRSGALELYRCGFEIAAAIGAPRVAVDAARSIGRLHRRQAEWAESGQWYGLARSVAEAARLLSGAAEAMIGLALIDKERGALPAARSGLIEALEVAERAGDRDAIAGVHQNLLGVDQATGDLARGLEHGWIAVATYESPVGRTRCMASLAGALADYGDRAAAEDAWTVVAATSDEPYYQMYAHDALGYLAALRGDRAGFEEHVQRCEELGWESGARFAKAEILYHRGLSYRALGELDLAEIWLGRALTFAEEHSFNRVLFDAEEALASLAESRSEHENGTSPAAPPELKEGLRAMRRELVGAQA